MPRKRLIDGRAVKSQSRLKVVSIEPLDMELPLYDITTARLAGSIRVVPQDPKSAAAVAG